MHGIEIRALGYFIEDLLTVVSNENAITEQLAAIATDCLRVEAIQRPSFSEVLNRL